MDKSPPGAEVGGQRESILQSNDLVSSFYEPVFLGLTFCEIIRKMKKKIRKMHGLCLLEALGIT